MPHNVEDMPSVWHISVALMHIFECNSVALIFHSMQYLHHISDVALVMNICIKYYYRSSEVVLNVEGHERSQIPIC